VGSGTTGMAVRYDPVATPFPGDPGNFFFEQAADAFSAGSFIDDKVADVREVFADSDHRYEMQRHEALYGRTIPNQQDLAWVLQHPGQPYFDKMFGSGVTQLCQETTDGGAVGCRCRADRHNYYLYFGPNQLFLNC